MTAETTADIDELNDLSFSGILRTANAEHDVKVAALEAENKLLRVALEPFAHASDQWDDYDPAEMLVEEWPEGPSSSLTVGHLRAARGALGGDHG